MNEREIFESLCRNALDFLHRAIGDLEGHPKYALINFAAALELFMKGRLILIDSMWIAEEPTEATTKRFAEGNLRTVGFELARQRIEALGGGALDPEDIKAFRTVIRHRNRVVHFFHPDMNSPPKRDAVAREMHVAWYFLHRLLSDTWGKEFRSFAREIAEFGARLQASKPFFDSIFEKVVKPHPKSANFSQCNICGYKAVDSATGTRWVTAVCRVCGFEAPSHKAIQKGEEDFVASCLECGGYQTTRRTAFGLKCSQCGETFSETATCEYCSEHWVGAPEDYGDFYTGCEYCDGAAGRIRHDE